MIVDTDSLEALVERLNHALELAGRIDELYAELTDLDLTIRHDEKSPPATGSSASRSSRPTPAAPKHSPAKAPAPANGHRLTNTERLRAAIADLPDNTWVTSTSLFTAAGVTRDGALIRNLVKAGLLVSNNKPGPHRRYRRPAENGNAGTTTTIHIATSPTRTKKADLVAVGPDDTGTAQGRILAALSHQPATVSELVDRLGLHKTIVETALEDLRAEGEIVRAGLRAGQIVHTATLPVA